MDLVYPGWHPSGVRDLRVLASGGVAALNRRLARWVPSGNLQVQVYTFLQHSGLCFHSESTRYFAGGPRWFRLFRSSGCSGLAQPTGAPSTTTGFPVLS